MLLELFRSLADGFPALNVFNYLTLRAVLAALTSMGIGFALGPWMIARLKNLHFGQAVRTDGPKTHLVKDGTPTMGGALILFAITVSTLLWADLSNRFIWVVLFVTLGYGSIGWIDDYRKVVHHNPKGMSAREKFSWQSVIGLAAAFYLVFALSVPAGGTLTETIAGWVEAGFPLDISSNLHLLIPCFKDIALPLGLVGFMVFTYVVIVGSSNAVNLTDGLDGLATGICGIASFTMFTMAMLSGRIDAAALSIALFGSCVAFLHYNFNPASIFLGDSGSLLLGFALGSISLLNVSRTAALTSLIIPLLVAGVPIIDTFSAIVRRKRAHISIGQADKGHIHHRLIQEGYNQKQAVLLIYAWCIMLSAGAAAINQVEVPTRVLIFVVLAIGSAAFAKHLHLFEPVLRHHYNKRTHEDELVTPDDPAFKQEEQAAEERKEERHHKL